MPETNKIGSMNPLDEAIASIEAGNLTEPISVDDFLAEVANYDKD